jgi:hypothetical protein
MYLPSEVMVFALVRETPTKDVVRDIAVRAGVQVTEEEYAAMPETGEAGGLGEGWYGSSFERRNVEDQRLFDCKDVEVYDNGSFIYRHRGGMPQPGNPLWEKDALSKAKTKEIAERFVGESGLLPEGCEFAEVRPDCTVSAEGRRVFGADGAAPRVLSREVVYSRRFEDIQLGRFSVRVNGEGEVYEVDCRVPRVEPVRSYPILGPEEARSMLRPGVIPSHYLGPARAEITSVALQYSQGGDQPRFVQPLYVFQGMAFGQSGRTELFAVRIPAVRPEYFTHEPVIPQSGHSFSTGWARKHVRARRGISPGDGGSDHAADRHDECPESVSLALPE